MIQSVWQLARFRVSNMASKFAALLQRLDIPDYQSNRIEWNAAWEQHIRLGRLPSPQQYLLDSIKTRWTRQQRDARMLELRVLQRDLTVTTTIYAAGGDLRSKWLALSPMVRQAYMLEGLVRTAEMHEGFEECRIYCPEVNLSELQKDDRCSQPSLCASFPAVG